jgi:ATPase subunit of ABC transporter with duplicated ATPase domains
MASKPVILEQLTFGYDKQVIFRDFSFATQSQISVIQGPSGCGKTTLLKLIDGLLVSQTSAPIHRPEPAFLLLQSDGLAPWLSGRQNIELFSRTLWSKVCESRLFSAIEPYVNRPAYTLSFGQRRSIELIRALVSGYPLLLLDEPLNFLDRSRRAFFLSYMADPELCASQIILTSHYSEEQAIPDWKTFEFAGDPPYSHLILSKP